MGFETKEASQVRVSDGVSVQGGEGKSAPQPGPSSLFLGTTWHKMVGTGALLHDMFVKKGLPCLTHSEFKKVHFSIIMEDEPPGCGV